MASKEQKSRWNKKYRDANKDSISAGKTRCYFAKKKQYSDRAKIRYLKNRAERLEKVKIYRMNNPEKIKQRRKDYQQRANEIDRNKILSDPLYKLAKRMRSRICKHFSRIERKKKNKSIELLGADWTHIKKYIEKRFQAGMSWSNYGEWHIDHIRPLASAKTENELLGLFHYKNLQPLWAIDNFRKNKF